MSQATKAKFLEASPFHQNLKQQGERYLETSGRSRRDPPGMDAKTVAILSGFGASYAWLVLVVGGSSDVWGWKHIGWALVVPVLFHPLWQVALGYALTSLVLGVTLSTVFQLAHCPALSRLVEETCQEHGVRCRSHQGVGASLRSHLRWLERMGRPALGGAV